MFLFNDKIFVSGTEVPGCCRSVQCLSLGRLMQTSMLLLSAYLHPSVNKALNHSFLRTFSEREFCKNQALLWMFMLPFQTELNWA